MKYYSTNHTAPEVALGEAVVRGLAPDKGLYMPERIENCPRSFYDGIASMSFHEIACRVAEAFFETTSSMKRCERSSAIR